MLYKIERNLIMLEKEYKLETISTDLKLYRFIINNGETIINCDPTRKYFQIIADNMNKEYKSEKGIINRLWDLYR